jgi:hypothetical protein
MTILRVGLASPQMMVADNAVRLMAWLLISVQAMVLFVPSRTTSRRNRDQHSIRRQLSFK